MFVEWRGACRIVPSFVEICWSFVVSWAGAYPRFKKWGTNHGERDAEGAEWVGCDTGCPPYPAGRGLMRWLCPFLKIFFPIFDLKMASFRAFCELILLR